NRQELSGRSAAARETSFSQAPTPIVPPGIEGDPIPKGADLQPAVACCTRLSDQGYPPQVTRPSGAWTGNPIQFDLIAVHNGILSQNGHPHHLELIVEPELPRPGIALQFQFD